MVKQAFLFLSFVLLLIFQVTVLPSWAIFGVTPDLMLIWVGFVSFYLSPLMAIFWSLVAGICKDMFVGVEFGLYGLLFPVYSFGLILILRKIYIGSNFTRSLCIFFLAFFHNLLTGRLILSGLEGFFYGIFFFKLIGSALLTAVFLPFVFFLLLRLNFLLSAQNDFGPEAATTDTEESGDKI